jgi:hypothetical protein
VNSGRPVVSEPVPEPHRRRVVTEDIDFGELHLFVGPNFVLTVRHGQHPIWPRCAADSRTP